VQEASQADRMDSHRWRPELTNSDDDDDDWSAAEDSLAASFTVRFFVEVLISSMAVFIFLSDIN
jgi:hypothetical protein